MCEKFKRLKQILTKKSLWGNWTSNSQTFFLKCHSSQNWLEYNLLAKKNYCAWAVIRKQSDFQAQQE